MDALTFLKNAKNGFSQNQSIISGVVFVAYICFLFSVLATDNDPSHFFWYILAFIVPFIGMFMMVSDSLDPYLIMATACTMLLFLLFYFGSQPFFNRFRRFMNSLYDYDKIHYLSNEASFLLFILLKLLGIGVLVITLSLFYQLFLRNVTFKNESARFMVDFLFFIPCLLSQFISWVYSDLKGTPPVVFTLFILELVFLFMYWSIPYVLRSTGTQILNEPISLASETILGGYEVAKSFAISMWISVNSVQASTNRDIPIFKFGQMPYISYSDNDYWNFSFSDSLTERVYIPAQRWNNIVCNYQADRVDLFVNGILERSVDFTANTMPKYRPTQVFVSGKENSIIHGAICNVMVFPEPLTKMQITQKYNWLQLRNPPLNNLSNGYT